MAADDTPPEGWDVGPGPGGGNSTPPAPQPPEPDPEGPPVEEAYPGYEGPPPDDEEWFFSEPPPEDPEEGFTSPRARSSRRLSAEARRHAINDALARENVDVLSTLRKVIAAQQGKPFSELRDQINQINAAESVLDQLDEPTRETYRGVLEVLLDLAVNCEGGAVDFRYVETGRLYDKPVRDELDAIAALSGSHGLVEHPAVAWFALREAVQRAEAERTASAYLETLRRGATVEDSVKRFKAIEPPTTKKADVRSRAAKSAREIVSDGKRANEGKQRLRLSSGYRTLDLALSRQDEPLGFIAPGEGMVVAGPTGTGKSSWTYGVVPAMCQDLVNWGYPEAQIIFAHTEEESLDKIEAMDMNEGGAFYHLADNLVVANVGTSRQMLAMTIYDCVQSAHQQSLETGRQITDFLPYALVLDYIQSLSEQGETEVVATATTAEFLLRGVQAWNPDEMEKFSGVSYREYTGSPWPEGMENHRVAGIYMAQLVKQDDSSLLYKAGDRKSQLSDFTLEDTSGSPAWVGPDNNGYAWEVKENDLRLFKQNAIRGSGVILQNATTIIILHRSRAYNNPMLPDPGPDGRYHLEDVRARFLLDKTRTGSSLKFVPMAFDLDHKAFRARYVDAAAEEALKAGWFSVTNAFSRSGDPLLPERVSPSPLDQLRY